MKTLTAILAGAFFIVWFFAVVEIIILCLSTSAHAEVVENPWPSGPTCQEDGITLWCKTPTGYVEVWGYEECMELREGLWPPSFTITSYKNNLKHRPTNNYYRHLWCASICYLISKGENFEYPVQCCDRDCPYL